MDRDKIEFMSALSKNFVHGNRYKSFWYSTHEYSQYLE